MRLALYQPDIAQNTGTILRLAACLGVPVDVIGPTGFDIGDRALKRAALDYIAHVELTRHRSFTTYLEWRVTSQIPVGRLILLTSRAETAHFDYGFGGDDTLLLGRESAGCPAEVHDCVDARIKIPIRTGLRSLNVAVAAAIVLGEALRQTTGYPDR